MRSASDGQCFSWGRNTCRRTGESASKLGGLGSQGREAEGEIVGQLVKSKQQNETDPKNAPTSFSVHENLPVKESWPALPFIPNGTMSVPFSSPRKADTMIGLWCYTYVGLSCP